MAELFRGTVLDVQSCDTQWCMVRYGRAVGYVERATLNVDPFPAQAAPAATDCFDAVRSGYGKGEDMRYCPRVKP